MAFSSFFVVSNSLAAAEPARVNIRTGRLKSAMSQTFLRDRAELPELRQSMSPRRSAPFGVERVSVDLEPKGTSTVMLRLPGRSVTTRCRRRWPRRATTRLLRLTGQFAQHVVVGRQFIVIAGVGVTVRRTDSRRSDAPIALPRRSPPSPAAPRLQPRRLRRRGVGRR